MGSCLNSSVTGDGLDIDASEYEQTNNTPPNDNNIHTHGNISIKPLPTNTSKNNNPHINKQQSIYSNSSGSASSILPDEITPRFQTIPSSSHTYSHININMNNKTPISTDIMDKTTPTGQILAIINDLNEFPDNHEINDKHHITHDSHSDEVLEAANQNNNQSNDIKDDINNSPSINGTNSNSNSNSNSDSDSDTDDDDEEEEEPLPNDNDYNIVIDNNDGKMDITQLSNIQYKCIQSASATTAGTSKGKTKTNQDSFILIDSFGPSSLFQLYGVCDGHGPSGNNVSKYVTDNLPLIINELLTKNINSLSIQTILQKSFELIETQLNDLQTQNKLDFDINYSGTTATIGLLAANKLYVANIGDSRTVLGKIPPNNKTVPQSVALSHDHDPKNSTEMIRIKKTKSATILFDDENDARIQIEIPEIIQNENLLSIDTILPISDKKPRTKHRRTQSQVKKISASVSRSIGDKIAHTYGGLISEPEIIIHNLSSTDIFVIFASDGIWQMIDNDDVMRTVGTKLNQNKNVIMYSDLQKTTSKLVREANISWQDEYEDYTDDITCVIARIGKIE